MILKNAVANYFGQGWAAAMSLIFVPVYIYRLGIESYAIVGVYSIFLGCMTILDFGLTPTITRQMAMAKARNSNARRTKNVLRTFEFACGTSALAMGLLISFLAPYMVSHWLQSARLTEMELISGLGAMAIALSCRWIEQFYRAVLLGLNDAVWSNVAWAIFSTIRWGGAAAAICYIEANLSVFFEAQAIASFVGVLLLLGRVYFLLKGFKNKGHFRWVYLIQIKGFLGGMFLTSILAFLLTYSDKIIVSKFLPLEQLGYYTLATSLAASLMQLVVPMNNVMFPRFTELVTNEDYQRLNFEFLKSCRTLSLILVPPAMVIIFLSKSVLMAWTNDAATALAVAPILSLLAIGTLCNGLVNLPYMLQLAYGWVRLSIAINVAAVLVIVPLLIHITPNAGTIGAAWCWVVLNVSYLIFNAHFMHRKILINSKWSWYLQAVVLPLVTGSLAPLCGMLIEDKTESAFERVALVLLCYIFSTLSIVFIHKVHMRRDAL